MHALISLVWSWAWHIKLEHSYWDNSLAKQIVPDRHKASGWYATKAALPGIVVPKGKTIIEHWLQFALNTNNELL